MFDEVTKGKIWRSAQLCMATILITVVPVVSGQVINFLKTGTPIDWVIPLVMTIGIASTWVVNVAKEWYKGVDQSSGMPTGTSSADTAQV